MSNSIKVRKSKLLDKMNPDIGDDKIKVTNAGAFKRKKTYEELKDKKFMPQIFKMQWPLSVVNGEPTILVYNESRTWEGQLPISDELKALFNGEVKIYVIATPSKDGKLLLEHRISDQSW